MRKWIDDANANPGPVKYVDILLQSQKHNKGAACYFRLTVLEAIPLRVKKARLRPESDKPNRNKVIIHEEGGRGGEAMMSRTVATSIATKVKTNTRKAKKDRTMTLTIQSEEK